MVEQNIKIAEHLVRETKERLKDATKRSTGIPLTCKMQLRDDCRLVENKIASLQKGRQTDKKIEALSNAVLRLKTTSETILEWKFNPLDAL